MGDQSCRHPKRITRQIGDLERRERDKARGEGGNRGGCPWLDYTAKNTLLDTQVSPGLVKVLRRRKGRERKGRGEEGWGSRVYCWTHPLGHTGQFCQN